MRPAQHWTIRDRLVNWFNPVRLAGIIARPRPGVKECYNYSSLLGCWQGMSGFFLIRITYIPRKPARRLSIMWIAGAESYPHLHSVVRLPGAATPI